MCFAATSAPVADTNDVTPYEELLSIVDHLLSKGAVAIEVSHAGSTVKANLEKPLVSYEPELPVEKTAEQEFEDSLYFSSGSEK